MHPEILTYNEQQEADHKEVCDLLAQEIDRNLPASAGDTVLVKIIRQIQDLDAELNGVRDDLG